MSSLGNAGPGLKRLKQVEFVTLLMGASHVGYSTRTLIGSQIIESPAYSNQILQVPLSLNCIQKRRIIGSFG